MSDARQYAVWPEPRSRSRSLKGSRPSVPHGTNFSYIRSIVTMTLTGVVSKIHVDFSRKLQFFLTPFVFCAPLKGFPLKLGISARGQKTRMMGPAGRERSLTIPSSV